MAGSGDAQDFATQIAALTAKMRENKEKFERLEAENTTIRAENAELLVRVETLSADTTPPAETPRACFRVLVNPMQPLEEEMTPSHPMFIKLKQLILLWSPQVRAVILQVSS